MPRLPSSPGQIVALVVGLLAYATAATGQCERWWLLLARQAHGLRRRASYRPVVLGQLGNVFLPARAGDAIRMGLASATHDGVSLPTVIGTLVAERMLDISCHVTLLLTVLAATFGPRVGVLGRAPVTIAVLVLLVGAFLATRATGEAMSARLDAGRRSSRVVSALLAPPASLRRESRAAILLSIAIWASEIAGWWAASHAVGLDLSLPQAAYVLAVASLALIMPIGFGAIGTLDAGILFSLKTLGVGTGQMLSFVLLLRVIFVLPSAALALALAWKRDRGHTHTREAFTPTAERKSAPADA